MKNFARVRDLVELRNKYKEQARLVSEKCRGTLTIYVPRGGEVNIIVETEPEGRYIQAMLRDILSELDAELTQLLRDILSELDAELTQLGVKL